MPVEPYLFFDGRSDEAIAFYRETLGAEVEMLMRFKECPEPTEIPPGGEDKVMHASLMIRGTRIMLSDGHCGGHPGFQGFSLVINVASVDEADRIFTALSDGGQVQMPLAQTFFSPRFGMLTDRFGMPWMVIVES